MHSPSPLSVGGLSLQVDNQLNSTIPVEFSELEALETLFLDENELTGSIPSGFGNILELKVLSLCKSLCCYALWREIRKDTLCFSVFMFLT